MGVRFDAGRPSCGAGGAAVGGGAAGVRRAGRWRARATRARRRRVSPAIRQLLATAPDLPTRAASPRVGPALAALYAPAASPLWLDARIRPTADARAALALIDSVAADGLEPGAYGAASLDAGATALAAVTASATDAAAFDVGLSAALLPCLRDLHSGRINPRTLGLHMTTPPDEHDYASIVRAALAAHRVAAPADLAPPLAQYRAFATRSRATGRWRRTRR